MQTLDSDYTLFAHSPLWDMQRRFYARKGMDAWAYGLVPQYVTSHPYMAKTYAEIVLGFWRDLKAQGKVANQPLYIIELGAGSGTFAHRFLLHFFSAFDAIRDPADEACYVMTDISSSTVGDWQDRLHATLQPFVAQGRLDVALFDAEVDDKIELQYKGISLTPAGIALPPVIIANYVFGSMRQDLFFLDKERLHAGWLALGFDAQVSDKSPVSELVLNYQKRRISAPGYPRDNWNRLIETYAERLPPCALLFPSYALRALERLSRLSQGHALLLCADRGHAELGTLASQQTPDIAYHGSFSLPVNFHALTDIILDQGGRCWTAPADNGLAIMAAYWHASHDGEAKPTSVSWRETAFAAQRALHGFNPNDAYRIKQTLEAEAQYLSPEQMLAFLRLSELDTKVFYLLYPYAYDFLAQLPEALRQDWYEALNGVWRRHLPIGEDYDLAFDLATLAVELQRWRPAIAWFRQSIDRLASTAQPQSHLRNVYFNLGTAHAQLAEFDQAEHFLQKALACAHDVQAASASADSADDDQASIDGAPSLTCPRLDDGGTHATHEQNAHEKPQDAKLQTASLMRQVADLQNLTSRCQQLFGGQTISLGSGTAHKTQAVFATLLGVHQAQSLYLMQRDPTLCAVVGVEPLQSPAHAHDWISRAQTESQHVLAILHPELGLVGVASLEYARAGLALKGSRSGRFYYWIGRDYRNRGYGTHAMMLLHRLANVLGLHHLFSTVNQTNAASRRTLAKLGYRQLPFQLVGERPGHHYNHLGPPVTDRALYNILEQLQRELYSGTSLLPFETLEAR